MNPQGHGAKVGPVLWVCFHCFLCQQMRPQAWHELSLFTIDFDSVPVGFLKDIRDRILQRLLAAKENTCVAAVDTPKNVPVLET